MVMIVQKSAEKKVKKAAAPLLLIALSASITQPLASAKLAIDQIAKKTIVTIERM